MVAGMLTAVGSSIGDLVEEVDLGHRGKEPAAIALPIG
jgi:hypothetical protein